MKIDQGGALDALPAMAWTALPDGSIDFINRRLSEYTGRDLDEGWDWQAVVHSDDLADLLQRWRSALASGESGEVEGRLRRSDGQYRWFLIQYQPMRDDGGRIKKWCGVANDIEEQRHLEETVRQRQLDLQLVVDSIPMPVAVTSPSGEVEALNQLTLDYFGKTFEDLKGWKASDVVHPDDLERTIALQLAAHQQGSSYHVESRHRRADGVYRWFSVHGLPWRDRQGQILRWLILQIDIDDRKRAEEALRESERNARMIVDSIPIGVGILTPNDEVEAVNKQIVDYFGKSEEELRNWGAAGIVHPDDLARIREKRQRALKAGEPYVSEQRLRGADGTYRWFQVRRSPQRDGDGHILRWYVVCDNIDEKKLAEEALAASQRNLQLIIDTIPALAWSARPDGTNEFLSKQYVDYVGLSPEQIPGWDSTQALHPDDFDRMEAFWRNVVASGMPGEGEARLRGHDGVYRWFLFRANPLRDEKGNVIKWYGVSTDIDDMKRAQEALAASERNLQATLDTIPARVGIFSDDGTHVSVNKRAVELSGLPRVADWRLGFHPDDLPLAEGRWRDCLATGEPFECEYRAVMADGTYRWHLGRRVPMRDDTGKVIRWYGIAHDIEDRKVAEQALAASERNLQATLDTIPVRVGIYSTDGTRVSVNKRALELSGLPIGADWRLVFHPDDRSFAERLWHECLASEEPFECEYRALMADGTYRWHVARRVPMRDDTGKVIRWYGISSDIEDRKLAEQALAASERNLQLTIDTIPALAWSARPDGTAEFINKHYLDYAGLTAEEARDWGWTAVVHPEDLNGLAATWQTIMTSGKPGETEARLRRHDGEYRWFLFRTNPLHDEHGHMVKWYGINTDIEDRKRSEEGFRAIVETTPECVKVVSRDGIVLRTNVAGAVMAGVPSPDDVVGQRFFDFVVPEHREQYREFHQKVCAGHKGFLEFDLVNAQGVRRHMETHAAPMRNIDGSIVQLGVTRDMTARKRAEDALKRSEAFLAEGQHLARMGNLSWNVTSGEIMWSEQLYRIFEFEPDTVVTPDRIATRSHPEDRPLLTHMAERAQRGESDFEYQLRIVLPDQSIKHVHLIAHRVRDHEDQIEYIGAVLDITQRRLSEEAIEKLRSELAQVTRVMSLGALTASIAHEVNQPLAGIITNAGTCLRMLAADPPNVEGAQETARRTIRDGKRAADVIARLRALFSKREITLEPVDLNDAAREVIALSSGDLQRNRVMLRTELVDELPPVCGDRVQLQQVIMNLLRNATDAMSGVDDRQRLLQVRTERDADEQVRLSVRDAGVGLPEGIERLFDAFYTTKSDGMGIGLSVSRAIIEKHNGRLWAQANDGPGATFSFCVPCWSGDTISDQDAAGKTAAQHSSAGKAAVFQ